MGLVFSNGLRCVPDLFQKFRKGAEIRKVCQMYERKLQIQTTIYNGKVILKNRYYHA